MKKIQMVDLKTQYERIKDKLKPSLENILESTAFINGPEVHAFQSELEDYLEVEHVIPCANGTDALQIAMMGLGLEPGDEVITSDFTFAATVEVIALLRLTPVLVDVEEDTFNISPEAIEKAITPKTKAIVPVHLFGQSAHMDAIMKIAKKHNLLVIEDNAQAIGANYHFEDGTTKKLGTIGEVGTTSFFPSKNLGCYGDGGAIFTNDGHLAHTIRGIVNHGMYERYHHDVVGVNSRLDSLQAAVLRVKLPKLDEYNEARRKAAHKYSEAFRDNKNLILPEISGSADTHVFHQYTLRVLNTAGDKKTSTRDQLAEHLKQKEIPFGIYYPIPLHSQKAYHDEKYREANFPVTNRLVQEVISLPMHTELDEEQIGFIAETVTNFMEGKSKK